MNGYVAALDGWLCHIHVPSVTEVEKVKSYFSGHSNVMDLASKPLVIIAAVSHLYQPSVLEAHLIVRHFMPHECITS
jgi:hypothetical protein